MYIVTITGTWFHLSLFYCLCVHCACGDVISIGSLVQYKCTYVCTCTCMYVTDPKSHGNHHKLVPVIRNISILVIYIHCTCISIMIGTYMYIQYTYIHVHESMGLLKLCLCMSNA